MITWEELSKRYPISEGVQKEVRNEIRGWIAGWEVGVTDASNDVVQLLAKLERQKVYVPPELWKLVVRWREAVEKSENTEYFPVEDE